MNEVMNKDTEITINKIISRVKHLEIRSRRLVEESLQSDYHSVFKGRGIEFHEVREYFPGDDVRDIDWNVTARMNAAFVKTYIEERQLNVLFAVDISGSSYFGSQKSKREVMAEIVAFLGFASFFNNDRAGLVLFSSDIEKLVPFEKSHSHLLRIIRDTWYAKAKMRGTDLSASLHRLSNILKKKSILFLLSDFIDTGYEKAIAQLNRRHEVIPIVVSDPMEHVVARPASGRFPVLLDTEDLESGKRKTIDLQTSAVNSDHRARYRRCFSKYGLDYIEISSNSDYFKEVEKLLRKRLRK